jgi:hypothetical protein
MWDTDLESTILLGELMLGRGISGLQFPVLALSTTAVELLKVEYQISKPVFGYQKSNMGFLFV